MSPTDRPDDDATLIRMPNAQGIPTPRLVGAEVGTSNTLPVGTQLSEFEITGLIGQGGFGIVYRAYDRSLQRAVALKEYMPSAVATRKGLQVAVRSQDHAGAFDAGLRSFVNEAHLLAMFDHPSLVKVYRFWEANGTAYIVMPHYEGVTLKAALGSLGGPPDEAWLKDLLRPLLNALEMIHRQQCFHRDIAPDNILMLGEGRPLLLDFGAARQTIGYLTHALTTILKPGYAPLEQYAEIPGMKQGAWTDIYALASVVYFAITGKAPMPSVGRVVSDTLPPLARVAAGRYSEQFLRAIDKSLSVKPEDRPQDVAQLSTLIGLVDRRQRPRASAPALAPPAAPARQPGARDLPPPPAASALRAKRSRAAPMPNALAATATIVRKPGRGARYAAGSAMGLALLVAGAYLLLPDRAPQPRPSTQPVPAPATMAPTLGPGGDMPVARPASSSPAPASESSEQPVVTTQKPDSTKALAAPGLPSASAASVMMAAKAKSQALGNTLPPVPQSSSSRCRDILERATLGENLSEEERSLLKENCR